MSISALPSPAAAWNRRLTSGERAALAILAAWIVAAALSPAFGWLTAWPQDWTLPVTAWIDLGLGALLDWVRPAARFFAGLLAYPMHWSNAVFSGAPWPVVVGAILALAWWSGRASMAVIAAVCLGFVLASGYWTESMNTLSLVAVSVPLALAAGLAVGILAYEFGAIRRPVGTVLDVVQTVPTFAYLLPLLILFGFGPVVGLIASAIYAAPPMARNVLLGLQRVDDEVREAAVMSGCTRVQSLIQVELPAARQQVMVGVNQTVMAALSMVIIASVIGGFDDIGWAVLLTMRKADFGQSLLAGMVIVIFAVLIDRITARLADSGERGDWRIAAGILAVAGVPTLLAAGSVPPAAEFGILQAVADWVDGALGNFTAAYGASLDTIKNTAMFYVLLPLRIGFDDAVLPFTWGWSWSGTASAILFAGALALAILSAMNGRLAAAGALLIATALLHTGVTDIPWPVLVIAAAALSWWAGGWRLAAFTALALLAILASGLWGRAMLSLYLCGAAVIACALVGGALGVLAAAVPTAWRVLRPVCDTLQTIPLFVFLIPVLMFFQIGEFSAFLAICAYAIVPMIRYTRHGLVTTPPDLLEAAVASGATPAQIFREVRLPWAAPTILLGLNQTILYAFAMLVIAALIGTTGLGQAIYLALGEADLGLGVAAGAAMALLALVLDRILQGFAHERRRALGLD